jgi:hypothetical protein
LGGRRGNRQKRNERKRKIKYKRRKNTQLGHITVKLAVKT